MQNKLISIPRNQVHSVASILNQVLKLTHIEYSLEEVHTQFVFKFSLQVLCKDFNLTK